ncbi:hypothetical protein CATYP_02420 [Corynebacterium atypicum]|uniref:Phage shock protein PspC N-terminal domain-containing protein n=1 Tax=Corynebacterium atypicum TaxID=191610 RepID=A0ABM5QLW5_9CORY|nr:PspC domain-containing protein [Corynebacterium atypicum]AIG63726.1 hypothetical protein CATYP_02420 [Corynebacterium atypicum]
MSASYVAPQAYPTFVRTRTGAVVAGVASGLSYHLKVDVRLVRLVLVVAMFGLGVGYLFYGLVWVTTTRTKDPEIRPVPATPPRRGRWLCVLALSVVASSVTVSATGDPNRFVLVSVVVVAVGAVTAWLAFDRQTRSTGQIVAIVVGAGLVFAGVVTVLAAGVGDGFVQALLAVTLTLAGTAVIAVPALVRMAERRSHEQTEKATAAQRAVMAAHLNDSVLQTLALIQKQAGDKDAVVRLARSQERELRQWLFDTTEAEELTVFGALERACGEVEDLFGVVISPVTVGADQPLEAPSQAAVLAAREAMVNAAKRAQVGTVDVYGELIGGHLEIFVRDRGVGFDPEEVPQDRHGLADSVRGRMQRVSSTPGQGTEVVVGVDVPGIV